MTFRASVLSAQDAFSKLRTQAAASKQYLTAQATVMQQPTTDAAVALQVIQHFGVVVALMNFWATTPGLAVYAQSQFNDPTYDVVAEFNTMMAAMTNARDFLIAAFPKDTGGFLSYQTLNPDASITNRTFTAAQLTSVVSLLNAVVATIS